MSKKKKDKEEKEKAPREEQPWDPIRARERILELRGQIFDMVEETKVQLAKPPNPADRKTVYVHLPSGHHQSGH
jgi:hypothetical protein